MPKPTLAATTYTGYAHRRNQPYVRIRRSRDGWRWQLRGPNGRIVAASSESFTRLHDARRNVMKTIELLVEVASASGWIKPPKPRRVRFGGTLTGPVLD